MTLRRTAGLMAALAAMALLAVPAEAARKRVRAKPAGAEVMALKDPARLVGLGNAMVERGSFANAFGFFNRALELDPRYAPALSAAGDLALRQGDGPLAFGYFAAWASQDPNSADAFLGMGISLNLRQQPDEALPVLQRAMALGAARGGVAEQWGVALDLLGRQRDAQIAYGEALQTLPNDRQATRNLALSLAISGDGAAALQLLQQYADDADSSDIRRTLAFVKALTGDLQGAVEIAGKSFPAAEARALTAIYSRLPDLSNRDKAAAVLFGRLPANAAAARADPETILELPGLAPGPEDAGLTPDLARSQARTWVQLASSPDRPGLAIVWRNIQREAGPLVDGLAVFVERTSRSNRLIVGPFGDPKAAQALISQLAPHNIKAIVNRTNAGANLEALGLP